MRILVVVEARPKFTKFAPLLWEIGRGPEVDAPLVHINPHHDREDSEFFSEELRLPGRPGPGRIPPRGNGNAATRMVERFPGEGSTRGARLLDPGETDLA